MGVNPPYPLLNAKMEFKKSAINLTELAIGILVLGIVVAIGTAVITEYRDSRVTSAQQYTVTNESFTPATGAKTLSTAWVNGITSVTNSTENTLAASQYSLTIDGNGYGTIVNTTSTNGAGQWNVTYGVYNTSDPQFAIPNNASLGLAEYGNWFTILVIIGIAGLVLSLIFMALSNQRGGDSSSQAF